MQTKIINEQLIQVTTLKNPTDEDWLLCKRCALNTIGKDTCNFPTEEWKRRILKAEHSPIRTLWFAFKIEMPYWVSVHFVRHKYGIEHFVQSQRDDRANNDIPRTEKPQGEMVSHIMYVNAQELMSMARRRLCNQASAETREIMIMIVKEVLETNPEFKGLLVPMCRYQGRCPEIMPCGKFVPIDVDDMK